MLRLFIENRELDLDKSVQVAVTKQFEDLTDPTVIINDWSKTVSIPFTARNNSIFGHIYNVDRLIAKTDSTDQPLTGIYFDPYKKLDMRLQWGDAVVMHGYAKIDSITKKEGKGTYNMTLFGQLGRVLQEMQKVTFDEASPDTDYIINGREWVNDVINKDTVYDSWMKAEPYYYDAYKIGSGRNNTTDFIGFAPNNSFNDDFDYESFQNSDLQWKFADVLNDRGIKEQTGVDGDTIIGDGMTPRGIGEYRSYLQLPFIYWHKLWQVWQDKCESVTGYQFSLDPLWFDYSNPYYGRLVMMMMGFNAADGNSFQNSYNQVNRGSLTAVTYAASSDAWKYTPHLNGDWLSLDSTYVGLYPIREMMPALENDTITIKQGEMIKFTTIPAAITFTNSSTATGDIVRFRINNGHYPMFEVSLYDENDNYIDGSKKVIGCTYEGNPESAYTADMQSLGIDEMMFTAPNVYCGHGNSYTYTLALPYNKTFMYSKSSTYKLKMRFKWGCRTSATASNIPFAGKTADDTSDTWRLAAYPAPISLGILKTGNLPVEIQKGFFRSGVDFTLNDLWNNEVSLFDTMMSYCKMFRIGVRVNDVDKTIEFKPMWRYFEGWKVTDWTNKVDMTKDFSITPVTFENKYVIFNYEEGETKLGEEYREKYGVDYGAYRIKTDYNFNAEEKTLFSGLHTGIVNTDNVLSWNTLYEQRKVVYSFPAEITVDCKDDDGNYVDQFGALFFHCGVSQFSKEAGLNMRDVVITDDPVLQLNASKFFYGQSNAPGITASSYPHLDVVYGDNCVLFNIPMENYTYRQNYADKKGVYDNFWDEYIVERYNIQNKKITCYADIKPLNYVNFDFKNFVKVGNQLCMVNKIYDYDVQGTGSTKVDLITIQNPSAYVTNPFKFDYIKLSSNSLTIPYDHYKKVTVNSSKPWELRDNEYRDTVDVWPTSGGSGTTTVYVGSIDEEGIISQLEFMQINPDAEYASDYYTDVKAQLNLDMVPSSQATIDTNPWYNEVVRGGTKQTTVTSSGGTWRISGVNKPAGASAPVSVQPTTGSNGTTVLTFMTTDTTPLGVYDYYIENTSGDIQTIRLYVTAS